MVVDRVLLQAGRQKWWAALLGRAKVQRAAQQCSTATWREALADPNNYALAATGRLQLRPGTSLDATLQADTLRQIPDSFPAGLRLPAWPAASSSSTSAGDAGSSGCSAGAARRYAARKGGSAALRLKQQLEGRELTAELAVNEVNVEGVQGYVVTPLRLSAHVGPRSGAMRSKGVLLRAGVQAVLAPAAATSLGQQLQQHCMAVSAQSALAVMGSKVLWQGRRQPEARPAAAQPAAPQLLVQPLTLATGSGAGAPAGALAAGPGPDSGPGVGWRGSSEGGTAAASKVGTEPAVRRPAAPAARAPVRQPVKRRSGNGGGGGGVEELPLVTPAQMQDGLQASTFWLERLRTDLQSWRSRAAAGELAAALGGCGSGGSPAGRPGGWSVLLATPHMRVSGLVGLLARMPLHSSLVGMPQWGRRGWPHRGGSSAEAGGGEGGAQTEGAARTGAAGGERSLGAGLWGLRSAAARTARASSARLFATGGGSLQLGRMQRAWLDCLRLEAAADLGLTSAQAPPAAALAAGGADGGGGGGAKHPAFALEQRGSWHALTLGAAAQLLGPVRLRGEWRFSLDSLHACPPVTSLLSPAGGGAAALGRHVAGLRPLLVDAAYGVDVVVPGSGGLARLVAWCVPSRREAQLEVRLL